MQNSVGVQSDSDITLIISVQFRQSVEVAKLASGRPRLLVFVEGDVASTLCEGYPIRLVIEERTVEPATKIEPESTRGDVGGRYFNAMNVSLVRVNMNQSYENRWLPVVWPAEEHLFERSL